MTLTSHSYGKSRVRVMRVQRDGEHHQVRELSIQVMLQGMFTEAWTHADNHAVVATDTIKNIINIVARENMAASAESLCSALADRFLSHYTQVESLRVNTRETCWRRLDVAGAPHPHSFVLDANGTPTVTLECDRGAQTMRSGITGFTFLKSTGSGWSDYLMDEYTTLPETQDRIAATSMDASWLWSAPPANPASVNAAILTAMLDVFATTFSHSVQDSLYRMGLAALNTAPDAAEISLSCPNKHYIPINLSPFGMDGANMVFTPTDEPHGQIECTVRR